jgi:hypothetical protein
MTIAATVRHGTDVSRVRGTATVAVLTERSPIPLQITASAGVLKDPGR